MTKTIQFQVVDVPGDHHSHNGYDQLWTLSDDGSIRMLAFPGVTDRATLHEGSRDWRTIKQPTDAGQEAAS